MKGEIKLKMFDIDYYRREDGSCPVIEFQDTLAKKIRAKLLGLQLLLERNGNELREPYSKYIEDGIFELRVNHGTNACRVLYFFMNGHKIIITNGFVKKTQKTPRKEIELAKRYRDDYLSRREKNKHE